MTTLAPPTTTPYPANCIPCTNTLNPGTTPELKAPDYIVLSSEYASAMLAVHDITDRQQNLTEVGMTLLGVWHAIHHPRFFFQQIWDGAYGSLGYREIVEEMEGEGEEE